MAKHIYVPLKSLKAHTKVDVYGVVKFFKLPYKSRGSDYCMMVSIVDPSMTDSMDKLKCLLFANKESKLPDVKLGDIIRFHRLAINEFQGCLQGQNSPGISWVVFSGDVGGALTPLKTSSESYTITDTDKEKIEELRRWASGKEELHEKLCSFSEVTVGGYFDLVCQVVYTSVIETDVGRLFKVWDGTQCLYCSRDVGCDSQEQDVQKDEQLMRRARGLMYDVQVFDNHFRASRDIKPGDYVKFINLHAAEYSSPSNRTSAQPTVEFVLHRGDSFGRSIRKLSPDSVELDAMKQRQEIVAMENDSFNFSEVIVISSESLEGITGDKQQLTAEQTKRPSMSGIQNEASTSNKQTRASNNTSGPMPSCSGLQKQGLPSHVPKDTSAAKTKNTTNKSINLKTDLLGDKKETDLSDGNKEKETCSSRKRFKRSVIEQGKEIPDSESNLNKSLNVTSKGDDLVKSGVDEVGSTNSSIPRCLLQTCTVIIGHPHVNTSRIIEVLQHEVPYKFRVRAKVYDYHPKATCAKSFLKLYCSTCHFLCSHPETDLNQNSRSDSQLSLGSTFKGVPHYNCPRCYEHRDSLQGLDSPPHLQYIYMLRLIIRDDSGMLMANLWRHDAVQFFQDLEPEEILKNQSDFEQVKDYLAQICPPDVAADDRPWIECCLKSYSVDEGTGYQIFDTVVV